MGDSGEMRDSGEVPSNELTHDSVSLRGSPPHEHDVLGGDTLDPGPNGAEVDRPTVLLSLIHI